MKMIVSVMLIVLGFSWISGVSADKQGKQSPESFMTCASGNGDGINAISVPATINLDMCMKWEDSNCADCIISLENQGCKLIEVVVTHLMNPTLGTVAGKTYLLSCVDP